MKKELLQNGEAILGEDNSRMISYLKVQNPFPKIIRNVSDFMRSRYMNISMDHWTYYQSKCGERYIAKVRRNNKDIIILQIIQKDINFYKA